MAEVLLVGGDTQLEDSLRPELESLGHSLRMGQSLENLLDSLKSRVPDFMIMDFDLAESPPWDVLAGLRLEPDLDRLPFLVLTGKHTGSKTVITALRMGAAEFLVKPADPRVLAARVAALLSALERRRKSAPRAPLKTKDGRLTLDLKAHRCLWNEGARARDIRLTPKEFMILASLMGKAEALVAKEELLRLLWPASARWTEENTLTLAQHIAHLRRKLGPAKKHLKTVWGLGYRFEA